MTLVPMPIGDYTPYWWEFSPLPSPVAGQPVRLRFRIHDPRTGAAVSSFAEVHERLLHFFIVGPGLEYFQHVHPQLQPDGWFVEDARLPTAGAYRLVADFLPVGGAPQLLQRSIVTRGYHGSLLPATAPAEQVSPVAANGLSIALDAIRPVAGRDQLVGFEVRDQNGQPVDDLGTIPRCKRPSAGG